MSNRLWITIIIILVVISIIIIVYKIMHPLRYFKYSEFDSPDEPGSGKKYMSKTFLSRLDQARGIIEKGWNKDNPNNKIYFRINSGYRTDKHNEEVGGVSNSAHTKGHAADISWDEYDMEQRKEISKALYIAGFRRFGPANSFIHVDDDESKPQFANWGYPTPIFNVFSLMS